MGWGQRECQPCAWWSPGGWVGLPLHCTLGKVLFGEIRRDRWQRQLQKPLPGYMALLRAAVKWPRGAREENPPLCGVGAEAGQGDCALTQSTCRPGGFHKKHQPHGLLSCGVDSHSQLDSSPDPFCSPLVLSTGFQRDRLCSKHANVPNSLPSALGFSGGIRKTS